MKKFVKALEDKGIMKKIVDSGIFTEKVTGNPIEQDVLEIILELEMTMDENLEDIFLQEAHAIAMTSVFKYVKKQIVERQKIEAMNGVDVDALFAKAIGKTPSKEEVQKEESKDLNDRIENMVLKSMSKALDDMFGDMFKNMIDDCK